MYLIEAAIRLALSNKDNIARLQDRWVMEPPIGEQFPMKRTKYLPLRPIMEDESKNESNLKILDHIEIKQVGLNPEDD